MIISLRFQIAGHAAADWAQGTPVLLARELAIETDTGKLKLGDGTSAWSDLPYQSFWSRWGRIDGNLADQQDLADALGSRMSRTANLSDLASAAAARRNLFGGSPTFADDGAAGAGGLEPGDPYQTPTGELRIKR